MNIAHGLALGRSEEDDACEDCVRSGLSADPKRILSCRSHHNDLLLDSHSGFQQLMSAWRVGVIVTEQTTTGESLWGILFSSLTLNAIAGKRWMTWRHLQTIAAMALSIRWGGCVSGHVHAHSGWARGSLGIPNF